jgi:hypothetical protein
MDRSRGLVIAGPALTALATVSVRLTPAARSHVRVGAAAADPGDRRPLRRPDAADAMTPTRSPAFAHMIDA